MKVCFLIDDYSAVGGIQRITPIVCNALAEYHTVSVVSIYNENNCGNRDLYDESVALTTLIEGKKEYIKQSLKAVGLLRSYLLKNKIDFLVSSSEMLVPYCYLATIGTEIPFLCWTHTPALSYDETILQKPFKWIASKKASFVITLTESNKMAWEKKYHIRNVVSIANPIDPRIKTTGNYDLNSKKIITVGRICFQKNYETLVEVAKIVREKLPDWSWDIYGDGNDRDKIEKMVSGYHLESFLHLKGNVNGLYDCYKEYGMQVMTSRFEGFPMTLLEGLANGLPLIGFDVDGVGEVIKHEKNGYLVPPFDVSGMAERIVRLASNNELRADFSARSFDLRSEYDIKSAVTKWNELFKKK